MIIKNIIIYLLLVSLSYIFYILFIGYLSYYVFFITVTTPILSILLLLFYKSKSHLHFINNRNTFIQEEKNIIQICKDTPLMGYCRIKLLNKKYLLKKEINDIPVSFMHCGGFNLSLNTYKQYDALNLFYIKRKCSETLSITILPKDIEYDITYLKSSLPKHSIEYSTNKKGDDPTEIFDIHEYRDGDELKNIHWKLSLKHQKLLIKENALPIEQFIHIYCIFNENDLENDYVFQYLHFFARYLLKKQYHFTLLNEEIVNYEHYLTILSKLLWTKQDNTYNSHTTYAYIIDNEGIHVR